MSRARSHDKEEEAGPVTAGAMGPRPSMDSFSYRGKCEPGGFMCTHTDLGRYADARAKTGHKSDLSELFPRWA